MRIFGFIIEREKGRVVGAYGPAIIDLQGRVNILEHNQKVLVKEEKQGSVESAAMQSEVDKVLNSGQTQERVADLWG
ncbi:unnamed protein product [marine sediment metagenome]|uniref:Uncharacterized protein n=1 Tax=marine sediment metagenome TaxID=412755 RepID=X1SEI1_9ZZZZ